MTADEFLCVTVTANPDEPEAAFKSRLVAFWSHFLRTRPDDYEAVYSEATAFEVEQGVLVRKYMVKPSGIPVLIAELTAQGLAYQEVDDGDWYSKAEASASDWFQLDR